MAGNSIRWGYKDLDGFEKAIDAANATIEKNRKAAGMEYIAKMQAFLQRAFIDKLMPHKRPGSAAMHAVETIDTSKVIDEDGVIYGYVGADGSTPTRHQAFLHAVFQEYGDHHSHAFPDEWFEAGIRLAKSNAAPDVKAIIDKYDERT